MQYMTTVLTSLLLPSASKSLLRRIIPCSMEMVVVDVRLKKTVDTFVGTAGRGRKKAGLTQITYAEIEVGVVNQGERRIDGGGNGLLGSAADIIMPRDSRCQRLLKRSPTAHAPCRRAYLKLWFNRSGSKQLQKSNKYDYTDLFHRKLGGYLNLVEDGIRFGVLPKSNCLLSLIGSPIKSDKASRYRDDAFI